MLRWLAILNIIWFEYTSTNEIHLYVNHSKFYTWIIQNFTYESFKICTWIIQNLHVNHSKFARESFKIFARESFKIFALESFKILYVNYSKFCALIIQKFAHESQTEFSICLLFQYCLLQTIFSGRYLYQINPGYITILRIVVNYASCRVRIMRATTINAPRIDNTLV